MNCGFVHTQRAWKHTCDTTLNAHSLVQHVQPILARLRAHHQESTEKKSALHVAVNSSTLEVDSLVVVDQTMSPAHLSVSDFVHVIELVGSLVFKSQLVAVVEVAFERLACIAQWFLGLFLFLFVFEPNPLEGALATQFAPVDNRTHRRVDG